MKQSYKLILIFILFFAQALHASPLLILLPTATVNENTICQGTTVTLTATGTGNITWHTLTDGSDTAIGTGSPFNINPNITATYYAKDNDGMSNGVTVTVYERPTVSIADPVQNACSGTAIAFNSTVTEQHRISIVGHSVMEIPQQRPILHIRLFH